MQSRVKLNRDKFHTADLQHCFHCHLDVNCYTTTPHIQYTVHVEVL